MRVILYRAFKTFAQTSLAVVIASGLGWIDGNLWVAAGTAGMAALFAFAYNVISDWEPK
jgi:hypothetical protein